MSLPAFKRIQNYGPPHECAGAVNQEISYDGELRATTMGFFSFDKEGQRLQQSLLLHKSKMQRDTKASSYIEANIRIQI